MFDVGGSLTYVLAEMDYDGTEKCFYTRGADLVSQERDGKKSYYVYDGHGSVRALFNEEGKVTDRYTYDAFGNLISSVGSTKNDFLFAGEQFDPVTGLYYLRARYMNPSVGTFISMDSYDGSIDDPVSLHKYLYANANPVSNSDPSGYNTLAETETSMGIIGQLNGIISPNGRALFELVGGIIDVGKDTISAIFDGKKQGLTGIDFAIYIASGLLTSLATNFSCIITKFMPPVGYVLMGIAAFVVGMVAVVNFAEGNTAMGIAQIANLVSIVFSMFNPSCFTGDTEVYTSEGLVCIEQIEVGDSVWAYNFETNQTELKKVLNIWVKETDEILHVSTSDGETIDTTTNHPFYVEDEGWVAASDLEIGDKLVTADGNEVEVTDVEIEKLSEPVLVYNLEIEDYHTYFVGEYGTLVHNMCENQIDRYANFNRKSEVGDGIEGHELLQNAWLKAHGYITRRGSGISRDNPSVGLTVALHKMVSKNQRDAGLFNSDTLGKMSLNKVIGANIKALSKSGVPDDVIKNLHRQVKKFIRNNNIK